MGEGSDELLSRPFHVAGAVQPLIGASYGAPLPHLPPLSGPRPLLTCIVGQQTKPNISTSGSSSSSPRHQLSVPVRSERTHFHANQEPADRRSPDRHYVIPPHFASSKATSRVQHGVRPPKPNPAGRRWQRRGHPHRRHPQRHPQIPPRVRLRLPPPRRLHRQVVARGADPRLCGRDAEGGGPPARARRGSRG